MTSIILGVKYRLGALAGALLVAQVTVASPLSAAVVPDSGGAGGERVIVLFDGAAASTSVLNAATDETDLTLTRAISSEIRVYRTSDTLSERELQRLDNDLATLDNVVSVSRDVRVRTDIAPPNDPYYALRQDSLYGEYGINVEPAWAVTRGEGVTVAVIDTGVVTTHPDLAANLLPGYDFVANGCDPSGSCVHEHDATPGWDSDPSDPGDYCTETGEPSSWHGTHVAGTIAAVQNNSIGVTGVAPGAKIVPVRALGGCGGWLSDLLPAMRWAAGLPVSGAPANDNPARILNMSLGGEQLCIDAFKKTVDDVTAKGALVVAAAGNENNDVLSSTSPTYPANCTNALTVAAVDDLGLRAYFGFVYDDNQNKIHYGSNYGAAVDIAAPGVGIYSTWNDGTTVQGSNIYKGMQGTSMATPHVSGVAALVLSVNPTVASPAELANTLTQNITPTASYPGTAPSYRTPTCDVAATCGAGIVNAGAAVAFASTTVRPSAPTDVSASRTGRDVTVSWTASSSPGSSAITSYWVQANGTDACETQNGTTVSCTITAMDLGTYTFTVQGVNSSGRGPTSTASNAVTVVAPPTVARNVTATRDAQSITVSWNPPASTGGLSVDYVVSGGPSGDVSTASTSTTFSGLTVGTSYTFGVVARNSEGTASSVSTNAITVHSVPSGVQNLTATRAGNSVTLAWTAPASDGGLSVNYVVSGGPSGNRTTTSTSMTFESLEGGATYTFGVTARNSDGLGPKINAAPVTITVAPTSVRELMATMDTNSAIVAWTPPAVVGGLPIEYVVSLGSGVEVVTASTTHTFTSLTPGTLYVFTVTARNVLGTALPISLPASTVPTNEVTSPVTVSTIPTTATTVPVITAPQLVRVVKRGSRTPFNKIYVAPNGATTKWTAVGYCSISSSRVVAAKYRGTCTLTIRQTLRGKTTRQKFILRVT